MGLTEIVNSDVAVTESSGGLSAGEIDAVGGEVCLGAIPRQEIVVADVSAGVSEHVDSRNDGTLCHYPHKQGSQKHAQLPLHFQSSSRKPEACTESKG